MKQVEQASMSPARIVIATRDVATRLVLKDALTAAGIEVRSVGTGEEVLAACGRNMPDLALLDVELPGIASSALVRGIRSLEGGAELPVLLLGSGADDAAVQAAMASGADDLLPKPFQLALLRQRVQLLLRHGTLRRELAAGQEEARELRETAERHARAVCAKSTFLANMSHEIRTPLNGLLGMLQLLQMTPLDGEQQEYIDTAIYSGSSLQTVINDILEHSRLEANRVVAAKVDFDLRQLIENSLNVFLPQAIGKGLILDWSVAPQTPRQICGDPGRIRQILFNLIGNAVKFTDQGSVVIRGNVCSDQTREDGLTLLLAVTDSGIGIAPQDLERIFEPFIQASGGLTRRHQGTGLGLAIAKRLVEHLGGSIAITSEPGLGTTVSFELPLTRVGAEQVEATSAAIVAEAPGQGLTLMVVEDNDVNRLLLRKQLEKLGHQVVVVEGGAEALAIVETVAPDALLVDIQMPEMDGLELTQRLKARRREQQLPDIPIIAVTAHAMPGDRERFLAEGMDGYLSKPVHLEELRQLLAACARTAGKALDSGGANV